MLETFSFYKALRKHFKDVVLQNTATLVNFIFLAVVLLLFAFKDIQEGLFLASILVLNVIIGIIQDLRAKIALERLQILTAPRLTRISNAGGASGSGVTNPSGQEEIIGLKEVEKGNKIKIMLGDQIPADGFLAESNGLEVNEALLTGESDNVYKNLMEKVLAGSIVVAGSGVMEVEKIPEESFVSRMTERIKQYQINLSPIQRAISKFTKYMSYMLIAIVIYVVIRGLNSDDLFVSIIEDIAALTGTLVPQGLILATTIFFAYGAVRLFKQQVLLQQINATEKLGRIKNLCVDKTGTLTETKPNLDEAIIYDQKYKDLIDELTYGYIKATGDSSEIANALKNQIKIPFNGEIISSVPFSSARKYGIANLKLKGKEAAVLMGAPDILLGSVAEEGGREWIEKQIKKFAPEAKRLILLAEADKIIKNPAGLENEKIKPLAMFVMSNPLRPGTREIIEFFKKRNVSIKVISGDNPQTVQAIAEQAGIGNTDKIITGKQMENWSAADYRQKASSYQLFARIIPNQKEKIIEALKVQDFTAMIGDGANDALAIKKADLGIAMFQGAAATRQIAEVVLMNNSFAALPAGVNLADTIITNIEMVASIFFNKVTVGLFLFTILAVLGYTYPISPRNITVIGYFTIGFPILYWSLFPIQNSKFRADQPFIMKVLPFAVINGFLTAFAATVAFVASPELLKAPGSNIYVVLVVIILGFLFFVLAPAAYGVQTDPKQKKIILIFASVLAGLLAAALWVPALSNFFDLDRPAPQNLFVTLSIIFLFGLLQYAITRIWNAKTWFGKNTA